MSEIVRSTNLIPVGYPGSVFVTSVAPSSISDFSPGLPSEEFVSTALTSSFTFPGSMFFIVSVDFRISTSVSRGCFFSVISILQLSSLEVISSRIHGY
jgi:hypothetical protein